MPSDRPGTDEPRRDAWTRRHLWQIQPVRDVLWIAAVLLLLWLGAKLSLVTVPLLLAALLAYLFEPVVQAVTRRGLFSRGGAAAAIIVAAALLIIVPATLALGYGTAAGYRFVRNVAVNVDAVRQAVESRDREAIGRLPSDGYQQAASYILSLRERADDRRAAVVEAEEEGAGASAPDRPGADESGAETAESAESADPDAGEAGEPRTDGEQAGEEAEVGDPTPLELAILEGVEQAWAWASEHRGQIGRRVAQGAGDAALAVLSAATTLGTLGFMAFLTAFFFFFISTGFGRFLRFWESWIPERRKGRTVELLRKMDRVIAGFVRGRLIIAVIQVVLFAALYKAVGVPAAILLGLVTGVLAIVPYLATISIPVAIVLMWLDPPGGFRGELWWIVVAPSVVYFLVQSSDDYVWTPLIQGKATDLDTPSVLFAAIAGGILAGIYGLLLGIPVAACAKILFNEVIGPKVRSWARGESADPLPLGSGGDGDTDGSGADTGEDAPEHDGER